MIFLTSLVSAQNYKIELSTIPEDKIFSGGKTIQIKVTLHDSKNKPISDDVKIILEDLRGQIIEEKTIKSNIFEEITIKENIISGEGKMIAEYKGTQIIDRFFITKNEEVKFEIQGEKLIITNIGNTKYDEEIYITIGTTTEKKSPDISVGESIYYRLVAPKGVYNVKVTDKETTLTRGNIQLTGTGQVIGALDDRTSQRSGITGTISPEEKKGLISYVRNNKFTYIFVLVIFGAMILLAIEKRYRKKTTE